MRTFWCILLLLFFDSKIKAQNLVPNPGFELYNSCSGIFGNSSSENVQDWFNAVQPLTTVDWYSSCFCPITGTYFCPPSLNYGYSMPFEGTAMIGFGPYSAITGIGETAGVKLLEPMIKDSAYCFSFWIKNSRHHGVKYSLKEIDIAFISDTSGIHANNDIGLYTTVLNQSDNGSWQNLSGYYIASGGEEFFLIGAFAQNPESYFDPTTDPNYQFTYYYFDDFNVYPCNKDSLLSVVCELPNVLTPNQDGYNDLYELKLNNIKKLDIQVLNRWGNVVKTYDGNKYVWDGTDQNGTPLTEGIYFVKAVGETTFGDVLSKQQFVHLIRAF